MKPAPRDRASAIPNITVTCRCSRQMRQEPGRRAGFLVCGCGTKVRVDTLRGTRCEGVEDNGDLCQDKPILTHPVTLCRHHVNELAKTSAFGNTGTAQSLAVAWNDAHGISLESQRAKHARDHNRRKYEEELRKAELRKQAQVYYIALRNCVKIGFTTNMVARMRYLMPDAVLATEPGDEALERHRHRQFKHLKAALGSEYFAPHPELMAHIETVLAQHGEPNMTGYPGYDTWHLGERILVPVKDAAQINGVSLRTVYEWIAADRLTVKRPDGKKRGALVNAKEVEQLVVMRNAGRLPRLDRTG